MTFLFSMQATPSSFGEVHGLYFITANEPCSLMKSALRHGYMDSTVKITLRRKVNLGLLKIRLTLEQFSISAYVTNFKERSYTLFLLVHALNGLLLCAYRRLSCTICVTFHICITSHSRVCWTLSFLVPILLSSPWYHLLSSFLYCLLSINLFSKMEWNWRNST